MFHITIKSGLNRGASWPISDSPITIGRSQQCDIRLPDLTISRKHCEVLLSEGRVRFRDLGSSNASLLNGKPANEGVLCVGDELAVGATVFVVSGSPASTPEDDTDDADTPMTVSLSHETLVRERPAACGSLGLPSTVHELHELFTWTRRFSAAESVAELVLLLQTAIQSRFHPTTMWIAWHDAGPKGLTFYPCDQCGAPGEAPASLMRKAIETTTGQVAPRAFRRDGERVLETTLVAPMAYAHERIGAVAIRGETPHSAYDEGDLDFLVTLIAVFAPFVRSVERNEQLRRDVEHARLKAGITDTFLGKSPAIEQVRSLVRRAAESSLNILVSGETGTGKELVARMIHELSPRASHPYVIVNCGAIPRELFESEMFGHEKGAFTGATRQKAGRFEEAHSGTLFLDEVGDLAPEHQAAILRAIETGAFYRVGGNREIRVDVRIVSATNRPLVGNESISGFREDLYHRLCGFEVRLPPLRDRRDDIVLLSDHILHQACADAGMAPKSFSPDAVRKLMQWPWPGNVRELRACIARAVALSQERVIQSGDILLQSTSPNEPAGIPVESSLETVERWHIERVLRHCGGNVTAAAQALGVSRATMYNKMKYYRIEMPSF